MIREDKIHYNFTVLLTESNKTIRRFVQITFDSDNVLITKNE
jgi:hypothetical protein